MEKKNLVATCMAIPGGILFSIGMVLALYQPWNMLIAGIVIGAVGAIVLALIYPIYRKVGNYPKIKKNPALIVSIVVGIFATLLLGVGMCLIMAWENPATWQIIVGILVGIVGLVGVILNPVINYSNQKNKQKQALIKQSTQE